MDKEHKLMPERAPVAYGYWSAGLGWYGCSLLPGGSYTEPDLRALYELAAINDAVAAERERCAGLCETYAASLSDLRTPDEMRRVALRLAMMIRGA